MPPQPAHPSGALTKPSSLSPDLVTALTHNDLLHNQGYQKAQQKISDLEKTVSMMVCEQVELRRMVNFCGAISEYCALLCVL